MISATDLRIGNYVFDEDGNIGIVKSIDGERFTNHKGKDYIGTAGLYLYHFRGVHGKWIQTLKPIPLTEELLLKCGFEKKISEIDDTYFNYVLGDFEIGSRIKTVWYEGNPLYKNEYKYLHQLQNLYFALTGKELEVKP